MTDEVKKEQETSSKRKMYVPPVLVAYGGLTVPLLMADLTGGSNDGKILMGGQPGMFSK